jgi:hypothetical protein
MKNYIFTLFFAAAIVLLYSASGLAQLHMLETKDLRLVYLDPLHAYLARYVARCFENSIHFHEQLWHYKPKDQVTVLLYDTRDYGNGGAKTAPEDLVVAAIAPFNYAFETMPSNERMNTIMNHEMAHIYAMDKPAGSDRFMRHLFFGKPVPSAQNPLSILYDYLCSPRRSAPSWYQEGLAVFLETWMAGGYGRGMGAYDEMVFRTLVADSARFYDPIGLESEATRADWHSGVNSYLYGTRFMSYLALTYGPDKVVDWISRSDSSHAYFRSQFKAVYGNSLDDEWSRWISAERKFQDENISAVQEYPTAAFRDITDRKLGSISRAFFDADDRVLYTAVNYPGHIAFLAAINVDTGEIKPLREIKGPAIFSVTSLAYDAEAKKLFYTTDNYGWRDLMSYDIRSGKSKMLIKDARIGDLVLDRQDRSLWGMRHFNGFATIVRIPAPYDKWHKVYTWSYGKVMYDIDVSPDGEHLSGALVDPSGKQTLIEMNTDSILAGDSSYTTVFDFGTSNPEGFVFSADGDYLWGTSYYTGVSNVFRYDIAADSMEAMTNAVTGFFRPIPLGADSLIVFRFTAEGFVPSTIEVKPLEDINPIRFLGQQIVEKYPEVKDWTLPPPSSVNIDSLTTDDRPYHAMTNIGLVSAYPVVEGYKDVAAYGMRADFADHLELDQLAVTVSYTPNPSTPPDERWHVKSGLSTGGYRLDFAYNRADFYDLFGPTKTSRKGYALTGSYSRNLIYDEPRTMDWHVSLSGYTGLERLPGNQNVFTSIGEFASGSTNLIYDNRRASLGAIDYEKGYTAELSGYGSYVKRNFFPHAVARLDLGAPLPLGNSSIWLRSAAGYAAGDRRSPFAYFYFGGFGNNWVDHRSIKRFRDYSSFPGVEIDEISGRNFARSMVEWILPPLRFRKLGFPAFYCSWARLALFGCGLATDVNDKSLRTYYASLGGQIDVRFQLLSHLRLTASVGYAVAAREYRRPTDEVMVSLRIL